VQAEILDLLRDLRDRLGTAILLITHNMGVVADIADRVAVMYHGEIVEISDVHEMFANPKADYTRRLLSVVPRLESALVGGAKRSAPDRTASDVEALKVENLSVRFSRGWGRGSFTAVEDVSFSIAPGETLAVVGESGSGKSTIAKSIAGLEQASEGAILIGGRRVDNASTREARLIRSAIGYVFQDPTWSLNPRHTVADSIAAPLQAGTSMTAEEASHRIDELLDAVRLPRSVRKKFPHELSGGQAQRVSIARAVIRRPSLLIADEPTSALDVSVQAQVLDLLAELQESIGFACLFITHDLAVVASFADRVLVMSKGKMVESGDVRQVLGSPAEEYTRRLVAAVPVADPTLQNERRMARRG
jgi:peptide/nickel transport system ATP-binding protein